MSGTAIVIGCGAWGLPAALRLQDRGVAVTLIERFVPGGPSASNGGTTRLWRLADTLEWRARSLRDARDALGRLGERLGEPVFAHTGLLWRDTESLPAVAAALTAIGEYGEPVAADRVGDAFPGLRPDGRDALYVEQAGVVHADRLLQGALRAFLAAGGQYLPGTRVTGVTPGDHTASVRLSPGSGDLSGTVLTADQVLIAAGPGTRELLPGLELELPLTPYIEQVVYFGDPGSQPPIPSLPSLVDCPVDEGADATAGIYAMPNGDSGYKVGLDLPLRPLTAGTLGDDLDRAEQPERTAQIQARVARDLTAITPRVLGTQVCTWTDSGDGDFVIGRTHPSVVLACGDSGEGFKYAAFMGEYLAALVMNETVDPVYQAHWNPRRFGAAPAPRSGHSSIGRH